MDLRRRLARLDPLAQRPAGPAGEAAGDRVPAGRGSELDQESFLADGLGLARGETAGGQIWWREDRRPEVPLPSLPLPDWRGLLRAPHAACTDWRDVLFLDTETTGLSGGTGTLPFLVGLGWWDEGGLVVRQLFLTGPHREAALLMALTDAAARFRVVVTYNGATFDLPLLRTRALLSRRADPCGHLEGWDLLGAARRLWGRRLPDCRQQTVEQQVCGLERGPGDIPGALIPGHYHAFLQGATPPELAAVLRHNRRDLAGLGRIVVAATEAAHTIDRGPECWTGPAVEAWSRALICERRGERERAAAWARASAGDVPALPVAGLLDAVRLLKRVGDWAIVAALLGEGLARWPTEPRLHYEAAVLYEHRLEDWSRALAHAAALGDARRERRLRARLERAKLRSGDPRSRSRT